MFTWYVLQCLAAVDTREKPSHGICWGSKMCSTDLRERDDGHQNVTTYTLQTQWWWSSKWDNLHIANRDQLWCTVQLPQNLAVQLWEQDDAAIWLNAQWAMLTVALVAENVHSCTYGWMAFLRVGSPPLKSVTLQLLGEDDAAVVDLLHQHLAGPSWPKCLPHRSDI